MRTEFELRHSPLVRAAAIAAPVIEFLLFSALIAYGGTPPESAAAFAAVLMGASLLHSWFVFSSRYELDETDLRIVHGPWRRRIALENVLGARPIRTLDRGPVIQVDLVYGKHLLLSPRERTTFLDALEAHVPHLTVHAVEAATRSVG